MTAGGYDPYGSWGNTNFGTPTSGSSGGVNWQTVAAALHIDWPAADVNQVKSAADAWHDLAGVLEDTLATVQQTVGYITSDSQGPAIDAFSRYVSGFVSSGTQEPLEDTPEGERYLTVKGLIPNAIDACNAASAACDNYADKVSEAKNKIVEAAEEFAATVAFSLVLTVISFGSSEAVGAAVAGGIMDGIGSIFAEIATAIPELTGPLMDALNALEDLEPLLQNVVSSSVAGGISNVLGSQITDTIFGNKPDPAALLGDGLAVGALSGLFGAAGEAGIEQMKNVLGGLMSTADPQTAGTLAQLIGVLDGSATDATLSATKDALAQLIVEGKVKPDDISGSTLGDLLVRAGEEG